MSNNNLIFNVCSQYRARQLFVPPNLNRIEMGTIPTRTIDNLQNVTLDQLNMRRKAEILQYNPNRQSNQTNSATKTQKFALLVNAPPRINNWNRVANNANDGIPGCSDDLTPVPTSSSDVPGPIMNLIYDKNIPLYNYINPIQTRGYTDVTNVLPNTEFQFNYTKNILIQESTPTDVISVYFKDLNEQSQTVPLSFTIPLGVYMSGTIPTSNSASMTITLTNITVGLYLNDGLITTIPITNPSNSIVFNVSGKTGNFKFLKYLKNISATNYQVTVQRDMIYTIKINYTLTIANYVSTNFSNISFGIVANMDYSQGTIENCNVTSYPSLSGYVKTTITDK
jgi:hypothetical protein